LQTLAQTGSAGGARPKAQVYLQEDKASSVPRPGYQPWLVKFTAPSLPLGHEEGLCEAAYLTMAQCCHVPSWQLTTTQIPWLALPRFDCSATGRYHLHSLAGLLHADFRVPSLDYEDLIKATVLLCKNVQAGQTQFMRAIFNLFAVNQDDHAKNWAFLQDDQGLWTPAPFFDVTFSPSPYNEHMMSYAGYGAKPPRKAIEALAKQANFSSWEEIKETIEKIITAIQQWDSIALGLGIRAQTRKLITARLNQSYQENKHLL
jgi:serine/threonine-protein kinase HipA